MVAGVEDPREADACETPEGSQIGRFIHVRDGRFMRPLRGRALGRCGSWVFDLRPTYRTPPGSGPR